MKFLKLIENLREFGGCSEMDSGADALNPISRSRTFFMAYRQRQFSGNIWEESMNLCSGCKSIATSVLLQGSMVYILAPITFIPSLCPCLSN